MRRVLVLGGYGSFGARISERLAGSGLFEVLVAGRNLERATAYCRKHHAMTPVRLDTSGNLSVLAKLRPWLVVHTAGPFQGADYDVARACLAIGSHYIDIADGRDFVANFDSLDAQAQAAGVTLISGASTVPALTSAVVEQLSRELDRVTLISGAISAGARPVPGRSVVAAILSYVGQLLVLRQGGRSFPARGWRAMQRRSFAVTGVAPLRGQFVALCDVPDLVLLSDRHPDRPLVLFRAGSGSGVGNWVLWLLGWLVQWGFLRSLLPLSGMIMAITAWISRFGSDRSAMAVTVTGLQAGRIVERQWTLIAEAGLGPNTPSLPAVLLAEQLTDGRLSYGAYPAVGLISLHAFGPDFQALGFATETVLIRNEPPLYRRLMGDAFDRLPDAVRQMHTIGGAALAEGTAQVSRGWNPVARLIGWIMGFPPAAKETPVQVQFREHRGIETWTRRFGSHGFASRLSQNGNHLIERFGPLRFEFDLSVQPHGLSMDPRRWSCGPVPLPLCLGPRSIARERDVDGVFHFDVSISLPVIGLLVAYRGWLKPL